MAQLPDTCISCFYHYKQWLASNKQKKSLAVSLDSDKQYGLDKKHLRNLNFLCRKWHSTILLTKVIFKRNTHSDTLELKSNVILNHVRFVNCKYWTSPLILREAGSFTGLSLHTPGTTVYSHLLTQGWTGFSSLQICISKHCISIVHYSLGLLEEVDFGLLQIRGTNINP